MCHLVQICWLTPFPTGIQSRGRDDKKAACGDDRGARRTGQVHAIWL